MGDRVKHKSRGSSSSRLRKKKKTRKRSSSISSDCVIITTQKNSSGKEKRKSRKRKRRKSTASDSRSSDSSATRLGAKPRQLLGERPEFCRNAATRRRIDSSIRESLRRFHQSSSNESARHRNERSRYPNSREHYSTIERRVLGPSINERGRKREARERSDVAAKKLKKSHRRRRSSSSSCSSDSSSSRTSSISGESSRSSSSSSSSSSSDSQEKRRKRRRKKKLAKMMKREEKRRREERRKLKRIKEKSRTPIKATHLKEIKRNMAKAPQDRLLKDINVELADRARAMAPMTREQWEKKQSIIRRVYDDETGRQRLIKGDGEILEEIVSRDRHMAINRQATKGDGQYFQSRLRANK